MTATPSPEGRFYRGLAWALLLSCLLWLGIREFAFLLV